MQFNSTRFAGDPATYQNAMSPNLAAFAGTFNPVQQIGTAMNAASSMNKAGLAQQGVVGKALQEARAIFEVKKYEADLAAAQGAAETQLANNNLMRDFAFDMAGTVMGSLPTGGNSYGGSGSTGGLGDTFTPSSVSKYGTGVTNPMDSFRSLGIEGPIYDFSN